MSAKVAQVALDIIGGQPEELSSMAGVGLRSMAEDLLVLLLDGQRRAFDRHLESPLGPNQEPPKVEVDLDRAEAIALSHALVAVREGAEGAYESLVLRAIASLLVQIPDDWARDAGPPLSEHIAAVKENYE